MDMTVEVPELPELTFDEASHIYRLNGDIIPSVSKLMEPLKDQCYGGISKRTLENAAIKGSAVHNSIENWIKFGMRKTGEILKPHVSGHGRRLCGNCDKITFDTAAAEAISNSFYEDGVNEFNADGEAAELYVDSEGRYFMAEYHTDTSKDRLRTVQSSVAAAFVEKYGTQIEKGPKKE